MRNLAKNKLKGFSLVELLVAMAIIAVLLGLVGFGIATAQLNSRNAARRQAVADVELKMTDFLTSKNRYPATTDVTCGASAATTPSNTFYLSGTSGTFNVPLAGAQLCRSASGGQASDASSTSFCYAQPAGNGSFVLCAELEGGGDPFCKKSDPALASCTP